jgi:hypothetical protein
MLPERKKAPDRVARYLHSVHLVSLSQKKLQPVGIRTQSQAIFVTAAMPFIRDSVVKAIS